MASVVKLPSLCINVPFDPTYQLHTLLYCNIEWFQEFSSCYLHKLHFYVQCSKVKRSSKACIGILSNLCSDSSIQLSSTMDFSLCISLLIRFLVPTILVFLAFNSTDNLREVRKLSVVTFRPFPANGSMSFITTCPGIDWVARRWSSFPT